MNRSTISVVIPTYNGAQYLGDAIQSVLDQTRPALEILVVDDASPEDASGIAGSFRDTRVRYIRHAKNRGAVAARKTGVDASSGDFIAFLDQDDLFHARKLETHLDFFLKHPDTGVTYNARFETQEDGQTICGIRHPPGRLGLADWVLGFPVSPSDVVLRRDWALRDEIWYDGFSRQAEHVIFNGQEIVFGGRLALAGCRFANVGRPLNYRRHHPSRVLAHLADRCRTELACQKIIFSDPRCPQEVRALADVATSNIYVMWAYTAYLQQEFELGRQFLKQAMDVRPGFFTEGDPCQFLRAWVSWVTAGTVASTRHHEDILRSIFENLPAELRFLSKRTAWAIARAHLLKGLQSMVWGTDTEARMHLEAALAAGAAVDDSAMHVVSDELASLEAEFGHERAQHALDRLSTTLSDLGAGNASTRVAGLYSLSRAFRNYQAGRFERVPRDVIRAVRLDPTHLLNRGALSIFCRSSWGSVRERIRAGVSRTDDAETRG